MRNAENYNIERSIVMDQSDFEDLMRELHGSDTCAVDVDFVPEDGVWVYAVPPHSFYDDDPERHEIDPELVRSRLAEYFGVGSVAALRYDCPAREICVVIIEDAGDAKGGAADADA